MSDRQKLADRIRAICNDRPGGIHADLLRNITTSYVAEWQGEMSEIEATAKDGQLRASDQRRRDSLHAEMAELTTLVKNYGAQMQKNQTPLNFLPNERGAHRLDPDVRALLAGESVEIDFKALRPQVDAKTGRWEIRSLSSGGNPELVPSSFRSRLLEYLIEHSALRQTNVDIIRTTTGEPLVLPHASAGTAARVSEGGTIPTSDPTVGGATVTSYKYGQICDVSYELLTDNGLVGPDLEDYLARSFAQAIAVAVDADFCRGDGSNKPLGYAFDATVGGTIVGVTGATQNVDRILETFYSVPAPYRKRAWWVMGDTTAQALHSVKDANGRPIWTPSLSSDLPDQLLGRPVVVDPYLDTFGTAGTLLAFGDFSRAYTIREAGPIRIQRSDDYKWETDEISFRILGRYDGTPRDPNALRVAIGGGTA